MKFAHTSKILAATLMALSLGLTGCLTDSDDEEDEDPVITTPWQSDSSLSVGAQGNATLGTAVDLDGRRVMLSAVVNDTANARANMRSVDLLFAYHDSAFKIMSPVAAKAAGISVAANYIDSLITDTKFVKVTDVPANVEAAMTAFAAGTQVSSSVVVANDRFVVMTDMDDYVFVTVTSVTGNSSTGSGVLTVNVKQMAEVAAE